jgi:dTDP-4-dehydrorhamnose reductase
VHAAYSANPVEIPGAQALRLDVSDRMQAFSAVRKSGAEAVIHCAAMTNVDECERNPEKAFAVNGLGTENLAMAARQAGARIIYVSTDYVFDGKSGLPYTEADDVNPLGCYAQSKLRGELGVRIANKWAVARVSVLYGWNSQGQHDNFATWIYKSLKAGEKISLLSDQFVSATLADNAAEALVRMAEIGAGGVFHASGSSCLSRLEFGNALADVFGLDKALISAGKSAEMKWLAPRPAYSCLSVRKIEANIGVRMLSAGEGLRLMKRQLESGAAQGWSL